MGTVDTGSIQVIELYMMDKQKYFPLTVVSGGTVRALLYPFALVKTRLQIQKKSTMYKGTFDAFMKISKLEGFSGLYRGFLVSNLFIFPQIVYINSYETVRQFLADQTSLQDQRLRSLVAGGCASLSSQTLVVPIDIITQHLQMAGQHRLTANNNDSILQKNSKGIHTQVHVKQSTVNSHVGSLSSIFSTIYKENGVKGFYKGYFASIWVYAPNSALWWFFYDIYCSVVADVAPVWVSRLALQCLAAPFAGISAAVLTTPLDAIRARIQVENTTFRPTARALWKEEGLKIFTKGLSPRLVQSVTYSFFIILGYETIKRWSLLDEYKHVVRW